MIILGHKTAILGPQFCRILVLGPHFWWSGGPRPLGPLDSPRQKPYMYPLKSTFGGLPFMPSSLGGGAGTMVAAIAHLYLIF